MRVRKLADRVALALALLFTVLCVGTGLQTGYRLMDTDERVYRETLLAMRRGDGYYDAMRAALVRKEHAEPTQVRAIRPPTLYVALSVFPSRAWRWVVGVVYLAAMLLAWRLGRLYGDWGGPVAVALVGIWCQAFSYYLFLHAELWGMPLALGAALALRRERNGVAAALAAVAAVIRELYAPLLVIGFVLARGRRRMPWVGAAAATVAVYALHAVLAQRVLATHGYEAAMGNEHLDWDFVVRALTLGPAWWERTIGFATVIGGAVGLVRAAAVDVAARFLLPFAVVMLVAAVLATRVYWSAVWAAPFAAFLPAVFGTNSRTSASA